MLSRFVTSLLILFFLVFITAFSQNYRPVNPQRTAHFLHGDTVFSIRIDSAFISGNVTVLYNFRMIHPEQVWPWIDSCVYLNFIPWIGDKIILRDSDGLVIFLNCNGDSVFINTLSKKGDMWNVFYFNNGNRMVATVDTVITENVLDASDSVKIISLMVEDSAGNAVSNFFNGRTIKLGKNSGLVKTFNICRFPNDTSVYSLIGITNPDFGIKNFNADNFYDFNPGDEIHIKCINGPNTKCIKKVILYKQLSVTGDTILFTDSVFIYTSYLIQNPDTSFPPFVFIKSFYSQVNYEPVVRSAFPPDKLTLEMTYNDIQISNGTIAPNIIFYNGDYCSRPWARTATMNFVSDYDSNYCVEPFICVCDCDPNFCYYSIAGLNGFYSCYIIGGYYGYSFCYCPNQAFCDGCTIVYLKDDTCSWGDSINFDSLSLIVGQQTPYALSHGSVKIINQGNFLTIIGAEDFSSPVKFRVINLLGITVAEQAIQCGSIKKLSFVIPAVSDGIYVAELISGNKFYRQIIFIKNQ